MMAAHARASLAASSSIYCVLHGDQDFFKSRI